MEEVPIQDFQSVVAINSSRRSFTVGDVFTAGTGPRRRLS